jgi:hypothetical protein
MAEVEELLIRIDATTENLRRELKRADRSVQDTGDNISRRLKRIDGAFGKLGKAVSGVSRAVPVLGAALSVAGLARFASQAIDTADALAKTADKLGLSVEALQELRFAAERTGVAAGTLDMAMQRFTRRVGEAAAGSGELKDTLIQYGIAVRDSNGAMRTSEAVLGDLANAIQNAGTSGEQLRIAFKAFDSEGAALVNTLRRGSEGLDELRARAREAGAVMDNDTARAAEVLKDKMDTLSAAVSTSFTSAFVDAAAALAQFFGIIYEFEQISDKSKRLEALNAEIELLNKRLEKTSRSPQGRSAVINELAELTKQADALRAEMAALSKPSSGGAGGSISDFEKALESAFQSLQEQNTALLNQIVTFGEAEEVIARVNAEQAVLNLAAREGAQLTADQRAQLDLHLHSLEENTKALRLKTEAQKRDEEALKALADAQKEAKQAAEKAAEAYAKVWENAIEDVQQSLTDGIRSALDGNLRTVEDWSRAFLNIIKDLAANLLAQQLVIPMVSGGASALGIPGAPGVAGGGFNMGSILNSAGTLLTGGTTPGGFSLIGAGGGTLGNILFGPGTAVAAPYGMGSQIVGQGFFGSSPMLQGAFNNLSNPLNGPAGFAGNFIGSQLFTQSTGSNIGGTLGGIAGGMTPLGPIGAFLGALAGNAIGGMFGTNPASVGPTGVAITGNILNPSLDDLALGTDNGGDASAAKAALEAISDAAIKIEDDLTGAVRKSSVFGLDVSYYPNPEPGSDGDRSAGFGLNEIIDGVKHELDISGLSGEELLAEGVIRTLRGAFETLGDGRLDTALKNTAAESIEELLSDLNFAKAISDFVNDVEETPLTAVEMAFEDLADAMEEGIEKARDLGLSVQEATEYFEHLSDELSQQVADGFEASINEATGKGFLNQASALLEARDVNSASAVAAGLNINDTAGELFDATFKNMISGLGLDQLQILLADSEVAADAHASAIVRNRIAVLAVADATASLTQSYAAQASEAQRLADQAADNARDLRQAAAGLRVDQSLSPLSPEQRMREAQTQFAAAYALATDADPTDAESQNAIARLPSLAQADLAASQAYYGSSTEYLDRFNTVQDQLLRVADSQESIEQQQLAVLKEISARLGAANDNSGPLYVQGADGQYISTGAGGFDAGLDLGYRPDDALAIAAAFRAAGIGYTGAGEGQIAGIRAGNPLAESILQALGFADGGVFSGGNVIPFARGGVVGETTFAPLAMFGEAGPEAIMPLRRGADGRLGVEAGGGGGTSAALVEAVGRLEARLEAIERNTGRGARLAERQAAQPIARAAGR